jgi:hypothetical protein
MTTYAPVGSEFDVNSTFARSQAQADGAALAGGGFIVTWIDADFNTTAGRFIRAQIYDQDGTPVDTELTLLSTSSGIINPAVTGLAGGGFVVTWSSLFDGIQAQVFDAHGAAVAPAFNVSPVSANSTRRPDVAALDDGGFAIVWDDTRSAGGDVSGSGVHLRAYDAAGAALGPDKLVNIATAGNQADTSITALPDGHYVVTWTDRGAPGTGGSWLTKARILDAAGAPLGSEFVVNATTSNASSVESSVTVLANGNFAVAWAQHDPVLWGTHRIQVFDPSGAAVGSEIVVPHNLSGVQVGPKLVGLSDGGFAIAWTANYAPQSDGSGSAVLVQVFDAASQPAGGPMRVNTQQNGDQLDPSLTAIADGGFVVTWTDLNGAGADDDQVKAQVFMPERPVAITSDGGGDNAAIAVDENQSLVTQVVAAGSQSVTYAIDGGDDAALFTIDAVTGVLGFVNAPDFEAPGEDNLYLVRVRASNATSSDTQTLTVTVHNINEAPVIVSNGGGDTATLMIMENTVVVGAVAASDPEGSTTYSIVGGADAARFTIDAETGALTFVTAPDHEAPADADGDNRYEVIVAASDGAHADTQTLTVTVGDINEAPVITSHGGGDTATLTVMENTVVVGTVVAGDPEGTTATYSIAGGADADRFTIDAATGILTFLVAPDYDVPGDTDGDNRYEVIVAASDGALADTQTLVVAIGNVHDGLTINGTSAANTLTGGEAEDVINGLGGNDLLSGMGGADTITGGGGNDVLSGGDGDDLFQVGASAGVDAVDGGAGNDRIVALANGVTISLSALSGIEAISTNGYSGVKIAGTTAADMLDFSAVTLSGIASINGGSGNDSIVGSIGDDVIVGAAGNDSLSGHDGDDLFQVGAGAGVDAVDGGAGNDSIVALADGVTISLSALSGIEAISANGYSGVKIAGSTAGDAMDFSGVTLSAIASINGGSGNDTITGAIGDDVILGAAGNDALSGHDGNDTLTGGAGSDQFGGGAGADLFVYSALGDSKGATIDTIVDFDSLEGDRIDLSAIDASSKLAGDQAFTWIGDAAFHKVAGELRQAIGADGNVHVYADTSGDGKADFELILLGTAQRVDSDFIL